MEFSADPDASGMILLLSVHCRVMYQTEPTAGLGKVLLDCVLLFTGCWGRCCWTVCCCSLGVGEGAVGLCVAVHWVLGMLTGGVVLGIAGCMIIVLLFHHVCAFE